MFSDFLAHWPPRSVNGSHQLPIIKKHVSLPPSLIAKQTPPVSSSFEMIYEKDKDNRVAAKVWRFYEKVNSFCRARGNGAAKLRSLAYPVNVQYVKIDVQQRKNLQYIQSTSVQFITSLAHKTSSSRSSQLRGQGLKSYALRTGIERQDVWNSSTWKTSTGSSERNMTSITSIRNKSCWAEWM